MNAGTARSSQGADDDQHLDTNAIESSQGANGQDDTLGNPPRESAPHQDVGSTLLDYERQLVEELLDEDKLCILAAGLGWHRIVAVFLRLHFYQQPGVVLVLGSYPWQRELLCEYARHMACQMQWL